MANLEARCEDLTTISITGASSRVTRKSKMGGSGGCRGHAVHMHHPSFDTLDEVALGCG